MNSQPKKLPLSRLLPVPAGPAQSQAAERFKREIVQPGNKNNCNRKLAAGTAGEAWKVCASCTDGTCSTCSDCAVAKFPVDPSKPIPNDEIVTHEYIMAAATKNPRSAAARHVYKLLGVVEDETGIIPFTEMVEQLSFTSSIKFADVSHLVDKWISDHSLVKTVEWKAINLQLFGTLADLQREISGFHHNDCHGGNVMLTEWSDDTSQGYRGARYSFKLPPQRFCVKLIDFGQSASNVPECNTTDGVELWSYWKNATLLDLTRFAFDIITKIEEVGTNVCPEGLLQWAIFVLNYLRSSDVPVPEPEDESERLWALSPELRNLGVSEEHIYSSRVTIADLMDDPYFAEFRA
jgi:hypothetical protein